MKKTFFSILVLLICNSFLTAKVIVDYKSDINGNNLIKKYKLTEKKKGKKYIFDTVLFIKGKLIDSNKKPIINKEFFLNIQGTTPNYRNTLISDNNGFFEKTIHRQYTYEYNNYREKSNTIILQFSESLDALNQEFQLGNDIIITNPYEVLYKYPFDNKIEIIINLNDTKLEKQTKLIALTDTVILSTKTFSAQYYREKIKAINQAAEMLQNANINIGVGPGPIEELILDENKNLKENWKEIIQNEIQLNKEKIQEEIISSLYEQIKNTETALDAEEMLESIEKEYISYPKIQKAIAKEKTKLKEKIKTEKKYLNKANQIFEALEKNAFYIMNGNKTIESVIVKTMGIPIQTFNITLPSMLKEGSMGPSVYKILLYEKSVVKGNLAPKQFRYIPFRVEIPIYTIYDNISGLPVEIFFNRQLDFLKIYNFEKKYDKDNKIFKNEENISGSPWDYW